MSERYTRMFLLPEKLYAAGSPVLIAAGALLKDNSTEKVLAQIKLQNINAKPIKAVTVRISQLDTAGRPLGEPIEHRYLDLDAQRDAEFGQKVPVPLPDASTRSFSVTMSEVIFSDNSIWADACAAWEALPPAQPFSAEDPELLKQYRMEYGKDCEYAAQPIGDLWYCACGALNRKGEPDCHQCGKSFSIISSVDMQALTEKRDARLEQENKEREEAARKKAEEERIAAETAKTAAEKKKKTVKRVKIAAAIGVPLIAVCVAFLIVLNTVIIPGSRYDAAVELYSAEKYEEAIEAFEALDGYKDSESYIENAKTGMEKAEQYADAVSLMDEKKADSVRLKRAISAFEKLGDYKDSKQMAEKCNEMLNGIASKSNYNKALACMEEKDYKEAYENFRKCPDYSDAKEKMQECLKNLFSEAVSLYNNGDYSSAFSLFEYCKKNNYSVTESTEYMEKCNNSYKNGILNGQWIKVNESYPLYSEQNRITVTDISYRYVGNKIEFSVKYSIKKNQYTDAFYWFSANTEPYYTDFVQEKLDLNGSGFSFSVDYDKLMRGFQNGEYSIVNLSLDYQLTDHFFYASVKHDFKQEDLEKRDLKGNPV